MPYNATAVVLGCASTFAHGQHQFATLRAEAERRNVRLIGADSAVRLAEVESTVADVETIAVALDDPEACARTLATVDPAAVLTYREAYVMLTAQVCHELGLRGNDPDAVALVRQKDRLRQFLTVHGFPQPKVRLVESADEALRYADFAAARHWVAKPRNGSGSEGVSIVSEPTDLALACRALQDRGPFVLEEFVEGPEFSAEGLFLRGEPHVLALTKKQINASCVEVGHRIPASLASNDDAAARAAVENAMRLSGLRHGIFHMELWLSTEGPVLGEAHIRPGGDYLHLLLAATRPGLELYGMLLDGLLGEAQDPAHVPPSTRHAGIDFFELTPGTLDRVYGWPDVLTTSGILTANFAVKPGEVIRPVTESTDRHGCIAVAADTAEEVERLLRRGHDALSIDVR